MMIKKLGTLALLGTMSLGLAACNSPEEEEVKEPMAYEDAAEMESLGLGDFVEDTEEAKDGEGDAEFLAEDENVDLENTDIQLAD